MSHRFLSSSSFSSSFSALRGSLLGALGLSLVACGGTVQTAGSGATGGTGGATGGTGGATGGTGGATGGTGGSLPGCVDPKPVLQPDGKSSGFVMCADGSIDRIQAATCGLVVKDSCLGTEMTLECKTGADCKAKPNGSCFSYTSQGPGGPMTGCGCSYECASDADCGPGSVCACAGVTFPGKGTADGSYCIAAPECQKPADCPSGECGYVEYDNGCGTERRLACRTPTDECRAAATCMNQQQCVKVDMSAGWQCMGATCTIGRPLVVEESLRFAPKARRSDWAEEPLLPDTASLSPRVRAALAAHFTAMAAMEHASIGSFARFSLELLALGAPPALLLATQEAGADEILHAKLAYSLASAYSQSPVGPGPLCVTGVVPSTQESDIVRALVREACVGETIAAAEALALSGMVVDPALKAMYARVSADEARHAELGWRSLAWMLAQSPHLASVASEAFVSATESISSAPLVPSTVVSPEHGLLSSASLGALRAQAAAEIVEPCRRALLSSIS